MPTEPGFWPKGNSLDAAEIGRRRAAELHDLAVAAGGNPSKPYEFVVAEIERRGLTVESCRPGAAVLDGGRASFVPEDELIVHEKSGSAFDQAFLVAHELGHVELGDGPVTVNDADPTQPAEPAPIGFDRVVDYGRHQRREVQMDLFGREFLLPRHLMRHLHLVEGLSASNIAAKMQAPFEVVAQQLLDALLLPQIMPELAKPHVERPLNALQKAAATHRGKPYLLEAGPGTGKTQTLTGRIEDLLGENVDPRRILVLTFSNKAAGELAERVARKHANAAAAMWIGTFHAFGLDFVRRFSTELGVPDKPRMMDRTEAVELLEKEFPKLPLRHYRNLYDPTRNIADILSAISRAKDEVVDEAEYARLAQAMKSGTNDPDKIDAANKAAEIAIVYKAYERLKRDAGCIDFGDLVCLPVRLLESREDIRIKIQTTYDHVLVDEYQDVNRSSVRLLECLRPNGLNLWAVGDAKQSIYRFRGASSFNTARFGIDDFKGGDRGRLEMNYRSFEEITTAFSTFAGHMKVANGDISLEAFRGASGEPPELLMVSQADEQVVAIADSIEAMRTAGRPYREQAVLCTGNEKLSSIGRDLERLGIPVLFLGNLFDRPEVKDLLSILSLLIDDRAMGLIRTSSMLQFPMDLGDVAKVLDTLRDTTSGSSGLLKLDTTSLTTGGQEAIRELRNVLDGFDETAAPWLVLTTVLLDRTRIAADIAVATAIANRARGIAIWQLLNFLRAQPYGKGRPIRRLLDRVRRLIRIGDDRDLRQLPACAQGIDAVRLMTIHGAKGLEFPVIHVPGMNEDTLPGYPRPITCLPPDGMITGDHRDALSLHREGEAEERECLFYVAASRARDRLFLYGVTNNIAGNERKLSSFVAKLGPGLLRSYIVPSRALPPDPEDVAVDLRIDGALRFSGSKLALYLRCPRRFFYTHILHIGGKRTETDFMRMHEAVRSVTRSVVDGLDIADDRTLATKVAEACVEFGVGEDGALAELRDAAVEMVTYFRTTREGHVGQIPSTLNLAVGCDEIVLQPDDVLVSSSGIRKFRLIKTGHIHSKEEQDVAAAAFLLAAEKMDPRATVELVHLSDETTTLIDIKPKMLGNREKTIAEKFIAIRGGVFPTERSERTCPGCPAFFVCGPLPPGILQKKI